MDKELNKGGTTYDHWVHSTLAFSVIINLVTAKLFLETSYWNIINM
jgi:amino acid permease